MIQKWYHQLFGAQNPIQLILFNIITVIGFVGGIVSLIVSIATGLPAVQNIIVIMSIGFLAACSVLANRKGKVELASSLIIIFVTLFMLPPMFFTGGGYHSGMPLWFVIGMIFTFLLISGKQCWFILAIQSAVYTACFLTAYYHPELITTFPNEQGVMTDILQSMFVAVFTIGLIIRFQITTYQKMIKEREEQNHLLEETRDAADRANLAKTNFLSNMSHDIRTPINGILGMVEIAEQNPGDQQKQEDCIRKIRVASNHLLSLVNDVLDISSLESGKIEFQEGTFDLQKLLADCLLIVHSRADERGITIRSDTKDITKSYLKGSEVHVRRVILNILGNAVKYNKENGSIDMIVSEERLDADHTMVQIIVKDTGQGMSEKFVEHVFEPFMQENGGARSQYSGTGLGMSIAQKLVDKMNGSISVKSKEHVGTEFCVRIPFVNGRKEDLPAEEESEEVRLDGERILLAEDNELNREVAHYALEHAGAVVADACNGREAVEMFEKSPVHSFDCILMDIMMPVMNGIDAAAAIRKEDREDARSIPIIAMTANAYMEDVKKTKDAGMDAHLSKPIDSKVMVRTIMTCIHHAGDKGGG